MKTEIINKYGYEGYGIYCDICDRLRDSGNRLQYDTETLSIEMTVSRELIRDIINIPDLFCFDWNDSIGEYFYKA